MVSAAVEKKVADRQSRDLINRRNADLNADLRAAAKRGVGSCSGWYNVLVQRALRSLTVRRDGSLARTTYRLNVKLRN